MINDEILAYTAGYIDGDGCFHISKQKRYYRSSIYIVSTHKPAILFFKKIFGGVCSTKKRNEARKNDKIIYHFILHSKKAVEMTKQIMPFLVENKEQAKCFIEFVNSTNYTVKDQCIIQMKTLKNNSDFVNKVHINVMIKFNDVFDRETICKETGRFIPMTTSQIEAREKIRITINHLNTRGFNVLSGETSSDLPLTLSS
jgi:hypothetical protein